MEICSLYTWSSFFLYKCNTKKLFTFHMNKLLTKSLDAKLLDNILEDGQIKKFDNHGGL